MMNQGDNDRRGTGQQPGRDDRSAGQQPGRDDRGAMGNKPGQGADRGKVGQDTDGDGKVVQPGQKPGQSHGTGIKQP